MSFSPIGVLAAIILSVFALSAPAACGATVAHTAPPWIGVKGAHLVNRAGSPVRLLGVNRAGSEVECLGGDRIFNGPTSPAAIRKIVSWGSNAVRVPLNETCWLGINGVPAATSGAAYRKAIVGFVRRLEQQGLYVILDLQWAAPGHGIAHSLVPLPDAEHAPAFWTNVAETFKSDRGVLFDLFNEPGRGVGWECWKLGCEVEDPEFGRYRAVGMQALVEAVRTTGAQQPIMLPGTEFANDLSEWTTYLPTDPTQSLVASIHTYDFNPCEVHCRAEIVAVSKEHPVVADELGETDCTSNYILPFMNWADRHDIGYLAWSWTAGPEWGCREGPSLIRNYAATPTPYGLGFREHLRSVRKREAAKRKRAARR